MLVRYGIRRAEVVIVHGPLRFARDGMLQQAGACGGGGVSRWWSFLRGSNTHPVITPETDSMLIIPPPGRTVRSWLTRAFRVGVVSGPLAVILRTK